MANSRLGTPTGKYRCGALSLAHVSELSVSKHWKQLVCVTLTVQAGIRLERQLSASVIATWECVPRSTGSGVCVLHPNGDRVAACTNWTPYVWDTATQQLIASKNIGQCHDIAVSTDDK